MKLITLNNMYLHLVNLSDVKCLKKGSCVMLSRVNRFSTFSMCFACYKFTCFFVSCLFVEFSYGQNYPVFLIVTFLPTTLPNVM